MLIEIKVR